MPYADWAGVSRDLTSALEHLADGEFLIMGESSADRGPRRGRFGRQERPAATRYVQTLRIAEVLSAECVGATSLGGTWEMGQQTIAQLCRMGWLTPAESEVEHGHVTLNFEVYVELVDAAALADLMVATLAVIGAHPGSLVLQSSTGGLSAVVG